MVLRYVVHGDCSTWLNATGASALEDWNGPCWRNVRMAVVSASTALRPGWTGPEDVDKFSAEQGAHCGTHLADVTVSMSEFKKNPVAVLRKANGRPVAVLNRNRPAFYMLEPRLFEVILDELADHDLCRKVASRLADKARAIEVDIEHF
jgi:antitoxin StbD